MSAKRWATPLRMRALAVVAALGVLLSISLAAPAMAAPANQESPGRAMALSGSSFNAGYIIDDANFYQKSAMSQSQIQAFLAAHVTCTNSNCLPNLYAKTEARANDRNICLGYTPDSDAKELASTIIYKVQQSCGISARVLLVTLQKEQGLITNPAPTTGKLNAAMGWLCPDTAPCSNSAAGFFRQIYGSAWQLRRYNFPDLFGNYHVGTYQIRYSTSVSCGTKKVTIRNNATAALYDYTPYTPNAGALANLRGTAPCGSYGNRNFWVYYNDWFGSPLAGAGEFAITTAYAAHGGATGDLGAQTSTGTCGLTTLSCSKTYEHGIIMWTSTYGAAAVTGAIATYYAAKGGKSGSLGLPTKDAVPFDGGADGAGFNQPFTNAFISSSPAGTFALTGLFHTEFGILGGQAGPLGWPTSEKACTLAKKACVQNFQHGAIYSATSTAPAFGVVNPDILAHWTTAGGVTGALGLPTGDAVTGPSGSVSQSFAGGLVVLSSAGTFTLVGTMKTAFITRGGITGPLGWPTAERTCTLAGGMCQQQFQNGVLFASSTVSSAVTVPGIVTYFQAKGGATGSLGLPSKDAVPVTSAANGNGYNQPFAKGFLSSSASGTFSVLPPIRTAWGTLGSATGTLGWPTAEQICGLADNGCSQQFQHGTLYAHGTTAGTISIQAIADYAAAHGGIPGTLGYPLKEAVKVTSAANGDGYNQPFTTGFVSSSASGAFSVMPPIRTAWGTLGSAAGKLGWPTAEQVCGLPGGGCSQQFQHGTIYAHGTTAGTVSYQPIVDYAAAHGGIPGTLGYPLKEAVKVTSAANGNGYSQPFTVGFVSSSKSGAFNVATPIRTPWGKVGGATGKLGWPTADQTCGLPNNGCSQQFQNGTVTVDSKGTRVTYRSLK